MPEKTIWASKDGNGLLSYWTKKPYWFTEIKAWAGDIGTSSDPCLPSLHPKLARGECKRSLTPRSKCKRCRGVIPVNKSGVFRKHYKRHPLKGWPTAELCEGSGKSPPSVLTDMESRRAAQND